MRTFEVYEKYPSIRKSLAEFEKIVALVKNHIQLDETQFYSIHLCIYEIFINAIYHGNKIDSSKFVEFYSFIENNILTINIIDQGEGFDIDAVPNPLEDDNKLKASGRGVFITSHYAHSLRYERTQRGFHSILTFDLEKIKQQA